MSRPTDRDRRAVLASLGVAAAVSTLAGGFAVRPRRTSAPPPGEPVASGLDAVRSRVRLIMVTTAEETSHLVRETEGWVLTEKGLHPASAAAVDQLIDAVAGMQRVRAMTTDPRKHDRLGLGDPLDGGTGALVEIGDGAGEVFAKLIIGRRREDVYIRFPDDPQAWQVDGPPPPPLLRSARWLDLKVFRAAAGDVARVDVEPPAGPAYSLGPNGQGGFRLLPPHDARAVVSPFFLGPPALAVAEIEPVDVRPAEAGAAAPVEVRHRLTTRTGLVVEVEGREADDGGGWVTLRASGDAAAAAALNARVGAWSYGVDRVQWDALTTPLSALVAG